jgi:hypothetical protein
MSAFWFCAKAGTIVAASAATKAQRRSWTFMKIFLMMLG